MCVRTLPSLYILRFDSIIKLDVTLFGNKIGETYGNINLNFDFFIQAHFISFALSLVA